MKLLGLHEGGNEVKKSTKDSRIPLTQELEAALLAHKSEDASPSDPVFPDGVPRARTLKQDLEKVGIPYCDDQGRYADFHSLRYSWATHLQRQGVNSRMAMELMRHSDRKLTDKIYTDVNLLPLGETVRNLPAEEDLTHILTNFTDVDRRMLSQIVERWSDLSDELKRVVLAVVGVTS